MKNEVLPEFRNYLRANSLVQKKYIPFYAHWASTFFSFFKKQRASQSRFIDPEVLQLSKGTKGHCRLAGQTGIGKLSAISSQQSAKKYEGEPT